MNELIEDIKVKFNVNSLDELTKDDWTNIPVGFKLSESFIREFQNRVDWTWVSIKQKLSEEFIREFKDKLDWYHISLRQKLSESFIREFKDSIHWTALIRNTNVDDKLLHNLSDIHPFKKWIRSSQPENIIFFRTVMRPEIIHMGISRVGEENAIKKINKKYGENTPEALELIAKVRECFQD